MATNKEKLAYLDDTKWLLKQLVVKMGGEANNTVTFREYVSKLAARAGVAVPTFDWNPTERANLREEWNADDLVTINGTSRADGAALSTWKGRCGTNLTWPGTNNAPKFWKNTSVNGFNAVQFSGGTFVSDDTAPRLDEMTVFALVRLNAVTTGQNIVGQNTVTANRIWALSTGNAVPTMTSFRVNNAGITATGTRTLVVGQWAVIVGTINNSQVTVSVEADGKVATTQSDRKAGSDKYQLGLYFNGYVHAIRLYDKVISDAIIRDICNEMLSVSTAVAWPTFPANLTPVPTDMPMIGVNLSGAEFASKPTGGWPSLANFQLYRSRGIEAIRLPFRMFRVRKDGVFTSELAAMKTCLNNAATAGMKVIMDPHDGFKKEDGTENTVELLLADSLALLAEIVSIPSVWMWSLNNEPTTSNRRWWGYAQQLVDGIRAVYPTLRISIAGDSYSTVTRWNTVNGITPLTGDNTYNYYEGHVYLDENQSGTWGGATSDKLDRNQTVPVNRGESMLTNWVKWLQLNGLKGWIGETGGPPDNASYLAALDAQLTYCGNNNIPCYYWSAGNFWPDTDVNALERNGTLKAQFTVLNSHNPTAINP